jgi:FtsP/CotA-like multicopper oxidase with cupredoxin domain
MYRTSGFTTLVGLALAAALAVAAPAAAQNPNGAVYVQCPGDTNGDAIPDGPYNPNVKCMHLAAGDGFITMADGKPLYIFSFSDQTGVPLSQVMDVGALAANSPAPTIRLKENQEFYLNLTNVGMVLRPDLFDPHSVHFHGFPQAAPVFDGVPESSAVINMGASFTYYYKIIEPGTYMYHCHVEATEHMQMGMLGNLYVEPQQNTGTVFERDIATGQLSATPRCSVQQAVLGGAAPGLGVPLGYAYNDCDGSTAYDVEKEIQIISMDPNFHAMSENVQPLPFAAMEDKYPMFNGRGYPDTVNTGVISTQTDRGLKPSQPVHALVEATAGQRILLRLSSLATTRYYTVASTIPMRIVGGSARLRRGPTGTALYYETSSVTLGGGEAVDVIIDTTGYAPGTYLLYTTNLNYLSNDGQDLGGMMTEIRIQ